MKFLADGMLGKLTRWLRMLGHDVKYVKDLDDKELIRLAVSEQRVLLTRDAELHRRATAQRAEVVLIQGNNEAERLAALSNLFKLKLELNADNSRCPKCNARLAPVEKAQIIHRILQDTRASFDDFWICAECESIYWRGSHWKRIVRKLKEAEELAVAKR